MRIAYLSASYLPSLAANSVHVMKMCSALAREGHEVTLHADTHWQDRAVGDAEIFAASGVAPDFKLQRRPMFPVPGTRRINALLAARAAVRDADLGIARNLLSGYLSARWGVPMMVEQHHPLASGSLADRLFRRMLILPTFRKLIVITEALKNEFLRLYPELEGRILVAADGADPADRGALPLPPDQGPFRVGYVGHLYKGKGMELIAQIVPLCPGAHFTIVGGRPEDIATWQAALSEFPNIEFLGHQPHSEAASFISSSHVVLLPNQDQIWTVSSGQNMFRKVGFDIGSWTSPLKMFEYMAVGKPIIASNLAVLREVLRDGENAILCPPNDPSAWAAAIKTLCDDSALRTRLGETAHQDFLVNYTWAERARRIVAAADIVPAKQVR
jgi:glycosyltransferase involved in cell wall biosynthesis